jgi:hypothetical protein
MLHVFSINRVKLEARTPTTTDIKNGGSTPALIFMLKYTK